MGFLFCMTKTLLQKIALILVFALPITLILGGLLFISLPNNNQPEYEFVYATNYNQYNNPNLLKIQNGNLIEQKNFDSKCNNIQSVDPDKYPNSANESPAQQCSTSSTSYVLQKHNPKTNTSSVLTLADGQKFQYTGMPKSPDGYQFQNYVNSQFSPLSLLVYNAVPNDRNALVKGSQILPQNLASSYNNSNMESDSPYFIGWIKK